jgi:N-acetylglucosamine-6-sulfatase
MKKHILSKTLILIIFTQLVALFGTEKKPDIVFILLDDLRYDAMSFMDHPYIQTPNMDQLRARGAWIKNAFVTTSICCPSRASFLTGTYASRHGVIDNETAEYDPEITPPVSMYLQEVGYKTAMIGKWHMGILWQSEKGLRSLAQF